MQMGLCIAPDPVQKNTNTPTKFELENDETYWSTYTRPIEFKLCAGV